MKKLFLLVVVLAALTVFCSAAFAQYGYAVPTLETVRRGESTVNVYTYRDSNGRPFRTLEYYVNDGGGYGNKDSYYDNQGRLTFKIENDFEKNGEHKVLEDRITYSEDDRQFTNSRETTFLPDGRQRILTYTSQETENRRQETSGMLTDGQGAKIYDFIEVNYRDKDKNMVMESTLYYPDKSVHHINEVYKTDETKIRQERTFDADGKNTFYQFINFDADEKEISSETSYFSYKDGQVIAQKLLIDAEEGRMLSYTEKSDEYGNKHFGEGKLLDLNENKLADYITEGTENKDGSEYRVDSFVYPDGRVDLISKTVDANGNVSIKTQLDFQAAGEKAEETSVDDSMYKNFYNQPLNEWSKNNDELDNELIDYFEKINDVWSEKFDGEIDGLTEEFNDLRSDLFEDFSNLSEPAADDGLEEANGTSIEPNEDNSDGYAYSGSEDWSGDDSGSGAWSGDDGGSGDWSGDDGGSGDWSGDDGGSGDWSGDDGGSGDWSGDDGGSGDWD